LNQKNHFAVPRRSVNADSMPMPGESAPVWFSGRCYFPGSLRVFGIYVMRNGVVILALAAWVTVATWGQAAAEAQTLLRWDFIGTKELAAKKNLKSFQEVLRLPETPAFRDMVAQALAHRAAARFVGAKETNSIPELARIIQPLLPDAWQSESRFRMDAKGAEDADWMLALKLGKDRSQEWSKKIAQLAQLTKMEGASGAPEGWTAKRDNYRLSITRVKEWTILEGGFGASDEKATKEFRSSLNRRRSKEVISAEMNAPLLA
jgi:hypothetical protein